MTTPLTTGTDHLTSRNILMRLTLILFAILFATACVAPVVESPAQGTLPEPVPATQERLAPEIQAIVDTDPQQSVNLVIQFYAELTEAEQAQLEEWLEVSAYSFGPVNFAEGTAIAGNIEGILALPYVKWIEGQPDNQPTGGG